MLKHIVVWQFRNRANKLTDGATVKHAFESMRGQIPGLRMVEAGIDVAIDAQADDIVLYCEFDGRAALEVYQQHPSHLAAKAIVGPLVAGRHVVDYEV
jgi:hypothetical protein